MKLDYRVFVYLESLSVLPKTGKRREAVISFLDYLEAQGWLDEHGIKES